MSSSHHKLKYKNTGLDSTELRRRREEEGVQLRKQKREQQLSKRRNVNISAEPHLEEPSSTTTSMQACAIPFLVSQKVSLSAPVRPYNTDH
jgi:Importin beta binding domain